jgi:hypothetical protein
MDTKQVKRIADVEAKKEVKGHEKKMHKGVKAMCSGGKAYAKGGVTSLDMKKYGRNLARAMNQKSSGRGR